MAQPMTEPGIRALKARGEKVVCVTAYDFPSAQMADEAGVDIVLVGDSVGNTVLGYETTLPVSLEQMCHHVSAVSRGVKNALVVGDLPFGSYEVSADQAVESAIALVKAGAAAVKPEGTRLGAVRAILDAGIPVMGHVGLTPQAYHKFGGFKLQGKGEAGAEVQEAACALDELGVFAIVLELIPIDLAGRISKSLACPTIGIGAGPHCDGQVQVWHDLLGLGTESFRHVKRYAEARGLFVEALANYASEVREGAFPTAEHGFEGRPTQS